MGMVDKDEGSESVPQSNGESSEAPVESPSALGADTEELYQLVVASLKLSETEAKRLHSRLWMFSSRIRQPMKNDKSCNKTPFSPRWDINSETSYLTLSDPRSATQQECVQVYRALLAFSLEARGILSVIPKAQAMASQVLGRPLVPGSLTCLHTQQPITVDDIRRSLKLVTYQLGSYEIAVSYRLSLDIGGKHLANNVGWMKPLYINYDLRATLKQELIQRTVSAEGIKNALNKIQVKAYCTDKVTLPPYYSNRDIRWATWPHGIQFASHYACARVELELLAQMFEFDGAPQVSVAMANQILVARGKPLMPGSRRCFVTGRILRFDEYAEAASNTEGGRSRYHVGHIMPLTRGGKHTWENVAWQSDDGNRIQGNDTLQEIEEKLVEAIEFHVRRDMALPVLPASFAGKVSRLWIVANEAKTRIGHQTPEEPGDSAT